MGSMIRIYARCTDVGDLQRVRSRFPEALLEPPSVFASVTPQGDDRMLPADVDQLSRELDLEVVFLAFSSVSDAFQFTRSVRGAAMRHLQYGMYVEQGLWEEVSGTPEPWEGDAFFSHDVIEFMDPDDPDRERVARIYRDRSIIMGEIYPIIDARESARVAAVHYRLTDWLDDWHHGD
jgi:hypothetical protein